MSKVIGNVGLLDLTQATEESVRSIDRIGNIGAVIYRAETAHLLTLLKNAGNIGKTLEIPKDHRYYSGMLYLNEEYFKLMEPDSVFVKGVVFIDQQVTLETFQQGKLQLAVYGEVYTPQHLAGAVTSSLLKAGAAHAEIVSYTSMPRFESGTFQLTNTFFASALEPVNLVVNGVLELDRNLDMERFAARTEYIRINGKAIIYEEQSSCFYENLKSINGMVEVIPAGFQHLTKPLRLNARTIRRFKNEKLYTHDPIMIEADVSREALSSAIAQIKSTSLIICSEDVEDLMWERCCDLNTEIVSYEQAYVFIAGEETWSKDQLLAMDHPVNFIVDGTLNLDDDVTEEVLKDSVHSIDLFGEIVVAEQRMKGVLYRYLRADTGVIRLKGMDEKMEGIGNIGMLTL
ncbi:hypothetical protein [Paenibacillus faecalis]|uniref:hypothetical protein n=1 Tax=Paenibacillus faecalis TaxID=2079532 RepID=UPI000D0ED9EC|nr:hypothetical protein [Paenibacillus faecalis]